jgi:serine/threonine-protein kinase RsbW
VSRGGWLLKLEVPSNPGMLSVVRGALGQLTEMLGFPAPECRAVVLAVDEALTNIIRHAYLGRPERRIEISFRRICMNQARARQQALEIVLVDRGVPIDRAKLCGRPLDEVRPGGLGLHFIRQNMDRVIFRRSKGKNQLRLVKILGFLQSHQCP